jgi:Ca-activated chloride channel homolog
MFTGRRVLPAMKLLAPIAILASAASAMALSPQQVQPKVSITPRQSTAKSLEPAPRTSLRVDSNTVLVPVTVTDSADQPVTDLSLNSFRLFEDNIEQTIVSLHRDEGPVSVGFIFDTSSSMKNRMDRSIAAIQQFLNTLMPKDEFFLIRFADQPALVTNFTQDPDLILSELSMIQPLGWTALNDAIFLGVHQMKLAKNPRRALIVLTDGGDNNSRYTDTDVRNLIRESDLRVYSIGLFERPHFLEKLGMDSGGRAYWAHRLEDLPKTIEKLSRDFRNEYVLGYAPKGRGNDGKYRSVRVQVMKTIEGLPLNVFWRRGYYAPQN